MNDVTVIGGGVIGCSVALELARRGVSVTVIDKNGDVGHGSTSASCGIVRCYYSDKTLSAMAHEGAQIWGNWGDYLDLAEEEALARFEQVGILVIPARLDATARQIAANIREVGSAAEVLDREQLAERFPFLDTQSHSPIRQPSADDFFDETGRTIEGGVFEPLAGYVVSPQVATANLRSACEQNGVTFRLGTEIRKIDRLADGGADRAPRYALTLADGEIVDTRVLVNCAGPHSAVVNRMASVDLPIETRPLRRETHAVENPTFSEDAGSPVPVVGDIDSGVYFRPESGGRDLIVGSLDPECDDLDWADDPDSWDTTPSAEEFERHVLRVMKRYPEVRFGSRRGIAGLYDVCTLDWTPIFDKTDAPGYYVAIGTSGSSFKTAPVVGRLMAELITACEAGRDHDTDPVHVSLERTGFDVNVGFFSRNRKANASSGTVLG